MNLGCYYSRLKVKNISQFVLLDCWFNFLPLISPPPLVVLTGFRGFVSCYNVTALSAGKFIWMILLGIHWQRMKGTTTSDGGNNLLVAEANLIEKIYHPRIYVIIVWVNLQNYKIKVDHRRPQPIVLLKAHSTRTINILHKRTIWIKCILYLTSWQFQ